MDRIAAVPPVRTVPGSEEHAISGGRGNLWGAFAGLLLLACVAPSLTHLHIEAYWEKAIQGAIILLAVVADGIRTRKANR